MLRQPIVAMMGHVDHGKTSLLDSIRSTTTAAREAGGITQAIGASIIPSETLVKVCGPLLKAAKIELKIPGLLFIDTPGHAAFTNLRKRGGNLADIAILVVDIMEGPKPQTLECLEILKSYKTPFIIAVNKIDTLSGYQSRKGVFLQNLASQDAKVQQVFEEKMYELVGKLFENGFNAERFDRVQDYTSTIAMVPTCALTGEGVPELLMVLSGLAQKYLGESLNVDVKGPAKGTVLEVKEEKGLGKTADVIIYDGALHVGDPIVIGGLAGPVTTKVKALLTPLPLSEMREKKTKFSSVKEVFAATGVKIAAPGMEDVVAGMPLVGVADSAQDVKELVQKDIEDVLIHTDEEGIIVKADSLGSLEALTRLLAEKDIPIKKASIGPITKKDIVDARACAEKDPLLGAILGFNIPSSSADDVKIITDEIIYSLIEKYEKWAQGQKARMQKEALDALVKPCRVKLMPGYVFRQSNPAVVGAEVQAGTLKPGVQLMKKDGRPITRVRSIQKDQESVGEAAKDDQVALALTDVIVGRQIHEGDTLYVFVPEDDFRSYKEHKKYLSPEEKDILREVADIMREHNPVWGV